MVTLKIRSWLPKSNIYCATIIQYIEFGQNSRDRVQTSFLGQNSTFQSAGVTLKIRSRVTKIKLPPNYVSFQVWPKSTYSFMLRSHLSEICYERRDGPFAADR